jgi:DNA-directed RNA polymerase subunit RPC12/RpoP
MIGAQRTAKAKDSLEITTVFSCIRCGTHFKLTGTTTSTETDVQRIVKCLNCRTENVITWPLGASYKISADEKT